MIAQAMKPHQHAVIRLAEVPGLGVDSAQQVIAEVGVQARTFASAAELTSWVGTCPGKEESAEQNHSSRSATTISTTMTVALMKYSMITTRFLFVTLTRTSPTWATAGFRLTTPRLD